MLKMLTNIVYFVQDKSLFIIIVFSTVDQKGSVKSVFIHTCALHDTQTHQSLTFAQDVAKNVLLSSIYSYQMFGAKLSWCQIVHFYYLGAKLSAFIILVPNCPLYYLGAKLSGAKLSYNQNQVPYFSFQTYTSPK